jgi:hypothetical protein
MLGREPLLGDRPGAPSTAPARNPRAGELTERIDSLAAEVVGFRTLLEFAMDWAATGSRRGGLAKSTEGNHAVVSIAKQ